MYDIILSKAATKQLRNISKKDQSAITNKIESLANDPKPSGAKALQGKLAPYYRVRCGDYRVVYSIEDDKLIVIVVKIGHRRKVYR